MTPPDLIDAAAEAVQQVRDKEMRCGWEAYQAAEEMLTVIAAEREWREKQAQTSATLGELETLRLEVNRYRQQNAVAQAAADEKLQAENYRLREALSLCKRVLGDLPSTQHAGTRTRKAFDFAADALAGKAPT